MSTKSSEQAMQLVNELATLAVRGHYTCDDSWYSCPLADGGCANEEARDICNCGADEHNAQVATAASRLAREIDALRADDMRWTTRPPSC